ncbi:MAG: hypothetical protein GWM89_10435 [Candidatus Dadabacteria bacterium]|nr:hypothetical protein [Candidatus Dadabacteria bacterium]NIY22813.1 hypothetical protein [Candidatus Dadabacteria bacterium]
MIKIFYGTKYNAWSHEKEFRILAGSKHAALEIPAQITEVILGEKIDESN